MMWGNSQVHGPGPQPAGSLSVVTTVWGVTSTSQSGPYSQNPMGPGSMGPGSMGPGMPQGGYNANSALSPGMYQQQNYPMQQGKAVPGMPPSYRQGMGPSPPNMMNFTPQPPPGYPNRQK